MKLKDLIRKQYNKFHNWLRRIKKVFGAKLVTALNLLFHVSEKIVSFLFLLDNKNL